MHATTTNGLYVLFFSSWAVAGCVGALGDPYASEGSGTHGLAQRWFDPIAGATWTLGFGARGPSDIVVCNTNALDSHHAGHDYGNAAGTEVRAIGAGTVSLDPDGKGVIIIEHTLTPEEQEELRLAEPRVFSAYWHVSRTVRSGDVVEAGEPIGTVLYDPGNSHLHFEMRPSYPVSLPAGLGCPGDYAGIGYVPGRAADRYPTRYGYLDPTATLSLLQRIDAERTAPPPSEPEPTPVPEPAPSEPASCAARGNYCYLAGSTAREDEQSECAESGRQASGADGRPWQCVSRGGALRWSQCFVESGRATDRVATSIDPAGATPRTGTDGATCWQCDRDATRPNAVEYWEPRDPSACGGAPPASCTDDGALGSDERWPIDQGCGDVAHLPEGGTTECYTRDASGATTAPHHYECARHDFGWLSGGVQLVWIKRCGC